VQSTEEQILVIPTAALHEITNFVGFSFDLDHKLDRILHHPSLEFRPRGSVEQDPGFKQLIPYILLRHVDDLGAIWLFAYTRGKGQGESRLHSLRSVGIGGHISTVDAQPRAGHHDHGPYRNGMLRELFEEVSLETAYSEQCVGMIYDDSTEVGRVHLGIVHVFDLQEPSVTPCEDDICDARFVRLHDLKDDVARLEVWSKLCLEAIFE